MLIRNKCNFIELLVKCCTYQDFTLKKSREENKLDSDIFKDEYVHIESNHLLLVELLNVLNKEDIWTEVSLGQESNCGEYPFTVYGKTLNENKIDLFIEISKPYVNKISYGLCELSYDRVLTIKERDGY